MSKDQLAEYISQGREIEFNYNGKKFSITYGSVEGKEVISFCECYKETTEVEDVEGLVKVERDGMADLWEKVEVQVNRFCTLICTF